MATSLCCTLYSSTSLICNVWLPALCGHHVSSCHGVLTLQYSHVHYEAVKNIPFRFCLVNAKVVNVHFILLIQSLLVLSWWFALGSITFLVVSNLDCIITEGNSSNSASIFCVLCMTELCVSCLLNPDQTFSKSGHVYTCRYWNALQMCDSIVEMQTFQNHSAAFFFYFLNTHTCIQAFSRRKQNVP